jgi:hypothetical protein
MRKVAFFLGREIRKTGTQEAIYFVKMWCSVFFTRDLFYKYKNKKKKLDHRKLLFCFCGSGPWSRSNEETENTFTSSWILILTEIKFQILICSLTNANLKTESVICLTE